MKSSFRAPEIVLEQPQAPPGIAAASKVCRDFGREGMLDVQTPYERSLEAALARENRFIRRMLDDRDRQFAALQAELSAMRRQFWPASAACRRNYRQPSGRGAS